MSADSYEREVINGVACVGCGKLTNYRCAWCMRWDRTTHAICENGECREIHEGKDGSLCARTRRASCQEPRFKR